MKNKVETITIKEKFVSAGVRSIDTKHRLSIGDKIHKEINKKFNVDTYEVLVGEEGDILLRPMAHIPARELWTFQNPKVYESLKRGLQQAHEGKVTKVKDVEKFLEDL